MNNICLIRKVVLDGVQLMFVNKVSVPCVRFHPKFQYVPPSIKATVSIFTRILPAEDDLLHADGRKYVTKIIIALLTALRGVSKVSLSGKPFLKNLIK